MIFIIYCEKYTDRTRNIQGASETRVLILTSGRTRQFMKVFQNFSPQFLPNESFCVIN
jgi:hypothetical protein